MKLRITIILLTLFAMTVKGMAQEIQHDTLPPPPTTTDTVADMTQAAGDTIVLVDKTLGKPRLKAGIRIGINEADMVYSHEPIVRYGHTWQTGSMLGIFAETPLWNTPFSLRPEITLVSRGTRLNWLDVNYDFVANYVDLRLPITFNLDFLSEKYSPYIMVAPQLNIPYNGTITYSADDYPDPVSTPITKADIRAADLSSKRCPCSSRSRLATTWGCSTTSPSGNAPKQRRARRTYSTTSSEPSSGTAAAIREGWR